MFHISMIFFGMDMTLIEQVENLTCHIWGKFRNNQNNLTSFDQKIVVKKYINSVICKLCGQYSFLLMLVESKSRLTSVICRQEKKKN